jgi:uncharacterized protein YjgD (DUF1641 family)
MAATTASMANDPTAGIDRLVQAAQEALTDSMVERLTATAANGLEVVDRLNDPQTQAAVMSTIDWLTELHRTGALDTLFQLVTLLHGARNALTDNMVERLFAFLEHMTNTIATEEVAELAQNATHALEEAADETRSKPASGGVLATLSMLSKPESAQALQFLMAFAGRMRGLAAGE